MHKRDDCILSKAYSSVSFVSIVSYLRSFFKGLIFFFYFLRKFNQRQFFFLSNSYPRRIRECTERLFPRQRVIFFQIIQSFKISHEKLVKNNVNKDYATKNIQFNNFAILLQTVLKISMILIIFCTALSFLFCKNTNKGTDRITKNKRNLTIHNITVQTQIKLFWFFFFRRKLDLSHFYKIPM